VAAQFRGVMHDASNPLPYPAGLWGNADVWDAVEINKKKEKKKKKKKKNRPADP